MAHHSLLHPFLIITCALFIMTERGAIDALAPVSALKIKTLYGSLDPNSIAQHLAFYELYPTSPEGQQALRQGWALLRGDKNCHEEELKEIPSFSSAIQAVVALVNKQPDVPLSALTDEEFAIIERLANSLPNRQLKGHFAKNEAEVLQLLPHEVDLSRGLLLTELRDDLRQVRSYEAMIDLMALQIRVRLSEKSSPTDKIRFMNTFIFEEMGFRFPPHSIYAKNIDLYTFLPAVLDARRGVCLGVSILYICLAQRLSLPLEMITPPGHIYVRHREGNREINIETTARGIHIDSESYLTIDTCALQQRNVKEVIGLAHFNQAAVFWQREEFGKALASYEKAKPYLPNDKLLMELMGYTYLFVGRQEEGAALLEKVRNHIPDYAVSPETMAEDFLNGTVDVQGIQALFIPVDETRDSIVKKRQALEKVVDRHPNFRAGLFQLASTWLQLHREGEALVLLERYHRIESNDPTAEYYLSMLYAQRFDYNKAWEHLRRVEQIVNARQYYPRQLKALRRSLALQAPE